MLALHDPSVQLNGHGQLWMPQPYYIVRVLKTILGKH